jgi:uroporphyrin-III C-methyltransferase/precorrin-2 dehydrogenase/sirohydrochlorin ferrochelatase
MRYFPLFFDLQHRNVLVVGGGEQATQKLRLVARTGARITLIAREISPEIDALSNHRPLTLERRHFAADDVRGRDLVFAADGASNAEVAAAAKAQGIPVNVVDAPELSSVIVPAIVDRDPVVVAVGTEGASPVIGRDIRARIEAWLPATLGDLARKAAGLRPRVREAIADAKLRRRFWERLLRGPFRAHVLAGDPAGADRAAEAELRRSASANHATGHVALIGCGPGDPDLLTLKALQRLQDADVLVYDRLVDARILDYARRDARCIDVGKTPGGRSASQEEINRILVREALKGHRVARLKGGDPMIFGRAAEEIAAVRAVGIDVEIVPGITAAHACAAAIGLPLTLRGNLRHFSIVTGASEHGAPELDWQALAGAGQAVAIYMGVRTAPTIERELRAAGLAGETPVVIVENGTLPAERVVATTLADLAAAVTGERIAGPAIIFVGLDWAHANLSPPSHVRAFRSATLASPARSSDNHQTAVSAQIGRQA